MRRALKDKLAPYKIPSEMKILEGGLPRNAMGKSKSHFYHLCFSGLCYSLGLGLSSFLLTRVFVVVNKKALVKEVFGDEAS